MTNVYSFSHTARRVHEPYYIVICGLSSCITIFHVVSYITIFGNKVAEHKMCFDLLSKFFFFLKHFSFSEEFSEVLLLTHIALHENYPLLLSDFNEAWNFSTDIRQIFSHISWKSVQWEPSFAMRLDGLANRQLDMTKLIVAFRNSANAPK